MSLMYPELLKEGLMFAFLGWFLMPAPLTLGWPLKARAAEREGQAGEREGFSGIWSGTRLEVRLWPGVPSCTAQAWWWAGLGRIHCTFSLADQGTSKTKPGLRDTKMLQKKPMQNVFARVTLL